MRGRFIVALPAVQQPREIALRLREQEGAIEIPGLDHHILEKRFCFAAVPAHLDGSREGAQRLELTGEVSHLTVQRQGALNLQAGDVDIAGAQPDFAPAAVDQSGECQVAGSGDF